MDHGSGRNGRVRWRRPTVRAAFLTFVALVIVSSLCVSPASTAPIWRKGNEKRAVRDDATDRIPYHKLTPAAQEKIQSVVKKPTLFRRMPANQIVCDPGFYQYLVRYPEIVVNVWQLMGITKVEAEREGPFIVNAKDGVGTVTDIELVYGDRNLHLMYCEGYYEGPMFRKPLKGRCVLVLHSDYQQQNDQTWQVQNSMDVFLQIDNMAIEVVTRTLHPFVGKAADINFSQSTKFVERMYSTTAQNGEGMQRLADRLTLVHPEIRRGFAEISSKVYLAEQQRQHHAALQPREAPANNERTASINTSAQ